MPALLGRYVPPSYSRRIRHGPTTGAEGRGLKPLKHHGPFDCGLVYQYSKKESIALTQVLVRQGFTDEEIVRIHMKPENKGFLWVRRQDDPNAASQELLDKVNRNSKRILSTQERMTKIYDKLSSGSCSENALVKFVDNPAEWQVRGDLAELVDRGVVIKDTKLVGEHGKARHTYRLAASWAQFRRVIGEFLSYLGRKIAHKFSNKRGPSLRMRKKLGMPYVVHKGGLMHLVPATNPKYVYVNPYPPPSDELWAILEI